MIDLCTCGGWSGCLIHDKPSDRFRPLVEQALHLVVNGERAPGGNETWSEWARRADRELRR